LGVDPKPQNCSCRRTPKKKTMVYRPTSTGLEIGVKVTRKLSRKENWHFPSRQRLPQIIKETLGLLVRVEREKGGHGENTP